MRCGIMCTSLGGGWRHLLMETEARMLEDELQRWAAMEARGSPVLEVPGPASPISSVLPVDKEQKQQQETPKPKKKRVRRQREELLYLRKKAKQLEDELSQLTLQECAADEAASLWEGIASRQQEVRFQAEKENQRLKRMLHNQIAIARRFESFLCGSLEPAPGQQAIDSDDELTLMDGHASQSRPGSSSADMMAELKRLYLTVDQVIHSAAHVTVTPTIRDVEVSARSDNDGIIVRWRSDVAVPFDWAVASRGIWRFMAQEKPPMECQQIEHKVIADHMVVRSFIIPLEEDCGARWKTRQVAYQFIEDERIVIVARSIWAALDASSCSLRHASFEENVRLVISRDKVSSSPSTIVRSFTQIMPDCADDADAGALSELVLRSVESRMQSMWPVIQNVLIEEDWTAIAEAT